MTATTTRPARRVRGSLGWYVVFALVAGALAGGLYGVALGGVFCGESMFHRARDASKVALVALVERLRAGGVGEFSGYYTAGYDGARFSPALLRNVVFAQHNLATDGSFSEFNAILCRNVLIYFDQALQARVHRLFYDSLATFGVLALGSRETLRFSPSEECYEPLAAAEKIYRKVR